MDDNLTEHQRKIKSKLKENYTEYYDYVPNEYINVVISPRFGKMKVIKHFDLKNTTLEERFEIYEKVLIIIETFVLDMVDRMNVVSMIDERNSKIVKLLTELLSLINNPFENFIFNQINHG